MNGERTDGKENVKLVTHREIRLLKKEKGDISRRVIKEKNYTKNTWKSGKNMVCTEKKIGFWQS